MSEETIKNLIKHSRDIDASGNLTDDGLAVDYTSNGYAASTFSSNSYTAATYTSNAYFQDNKSSAPTITSIHPTANLTAGDTVYIVGTGFDRSANVILVSNTNTDTVVPRGSITFNDSANITFSFPSGVGSSGENYDVRVAIDNTGLATIELDALDTFGIPGFQGAISGYSSGGQNSRVVEKFPFSSDTNAADVGDLTYNRTQPSGQSSDLSGYTSGGSSPAAPGVHNVIDKFPFVSDTNATDVGDLTVAREALTGQSSPDYGYASGGNPGPKNVIDKFPFASDANATDVGDLTVARAQPAGQSSTESGYTSGSSSSPTNVIDKFPFASDANATDVGDLTVARSLPAGQSSTVSGYSSAGTVNVIDKFPFASDANATDVGDMIDFKNSAAGQQV